MYVAMCIMYEIDLLLRGGAQAKLFGSPVLELIANYHQ